MLTIAVKIYNRMALYSRKEFAELCGLGWNNSVKSKIAMWVKRSQVIEVDGKINDSNPINRDWALKQRDSSVSKDELAPIQKKPDKLNKELKEESDGVYSLDKQLRKQQLHKLQVDTRLSLLKEEKIRGEVVPIELMKSILRVNNQSIITSTKDGLEELLINMSQEARLSGDQIAGLRGKIVTILNSCIVKAIDNSKRELRQIANEFSIKREVGEHD